jgi:signal transduction histidine kinase
VLEADRAMVSRIVENLLANAVKHTPGDSRIWVRLERADEGALLAVEDDGPGIGAEDRDPIFQPFRQGATTAAGSGVGLALVRRFAELHGGSAWVEPRHGGGSSFRVLLAWRPTDATAPAGGQPAAADSPPDNQA